MQLITSTTMDSTAATVEKMVSQMVSVLVCITGCLKGCMERLQYMELVIMGASVSVFVNVFGFLCCSFTELRF